MKPALHNEGMERRAALPADLYAGGGNRRIRRTEMTRGRKQKWSRSRSGSRSGSGSVGRGRGRGSWSGRGRVGSGSWSGSWSRSGRSGSGSSRVGSVGGRFDLARLSTPAEARTIAAIEAMRAKGLATKRRTSGTAERARKRDGTTMADEFSPDTNRPSYKGSAAPLEGIFANDGDRQ